MNFFFCFLLIIDLKKFNCSIDKFIKLSTYVIKSILFFMFILCLKIRLKFSKELLVLNLVFTPLKINILFLKKGSQLL